METHDDGHWKAVVDDGYLREDEHETFKFLRQLQAILERLVLQVPPYMRLDPPESLRDKPGRPITLIAPESQTLHNLRAKISELEDVLSERYDQVELREYGTLTQHLGRRSFYRGFLDKRRTIPLLQRSSPDVIHFLQKVPKFGDHLKRENHAHFGIHYHYLDSSKRRSDTVLCFKPPTPWPLFAEKHAQKSAHFAARPRAWSEDRRKTVYDVLSPEKGRFKTVEFRRPSSDSALVWLENGAFLRETKKSSFEIVLADGKVVPLE